MAIKPITPMNSLAEQPTAKSKTKKDTSIKAMSISLPLDLIERVKKYRFENEKKTVSIVIQEALEAYLPKE